VIKVGVAAVLVSEFGTLWLGDIDAAPLPEIHRNYPGDPSTAFVRRVSRTHTQPSPFPPPLGKQWARKTPQTGAVGLCSVVWSEYPYEE